ncbi:MAG: septal ring lytic transglycosylase RlpA family protein [Rhodospirillales bacterium]|nr:septal ring lytic transglycosylase RlpA family protein [Rhodospirillales bacterium]
MASLLLATPALAAQPATPAATTKPLRKSARTRRTLLQRPLPRQHLTEAEVASARIAPSAFHSTVSAYLADGQARLRDASFWRPAGTWHPARLRLGWEQTGLASWYGGPGWQGRRTAAGTRFNQDELTAAHATLPLGSRVLVTVPETGRSVVVTITDRPGTRSRIIDLSRAAAAKLGILRQGVARVELSRL